MWQARYEILFFLDDSIQHRAHLCSLLPDYAERQSLSDKAISFMPLVFKASDQCYLKDKLIFSFLYLLV